MIGAPLLQIDKLTKQYGQRVGCTDVSFDLRAGEVVAVVGESGSGKSTLLACMSGRLPPTSGGVRFHQRHPLTHVEAWRDIHQDLSEPERRSLLRTDFAVVHQDPRDGLRMTVSAGGNIGERKMAIGARHYNAIRAEALGWLHRVEIDDDRIDDRPTAFSGGMRQRLQIARALATDPKVVFMDEPTGGLDVSVQARLLDLIRRLVGDFGLSVVIVTHDLAVARLLAHRMLVMRRGLVVESGLTDQVLDDPQHEYSQLLVSSILRV
ncbi:MAG: phosphonate C-P lyase system protein PhnK [Rhodobacteraceae bacterium]|nr:phosphonate C-P lyase system protein PhnK [Paracoccaceae bacterium]